MRVRALWGTFLVMAIAMLVACEEDENMSIPTESESPTEVWITVPTYDGFATIRVAYSQSFSPLFTPSYVAKPGSIGMGSQTKPYGGGRTYPKITVGKNEASCLARCYRSGLVSLMLLLNSLI
ncbi:Piso0_005777 [Millerozyma farinosa CBS 7064]|uniref:Piso0_005777 protein n=1 Tax=Pichia sorbitophila (strain ATCC MYA-4447 / BCRC 22081 / CBS 7064 / NBRC 10061 / NRRL Y-12695) TaxID=559304 RepID=G8Y2W6_PICSO|nr:Piso0_005777 [Millerozyma farinosa CBS 7064]